MDHWIIIQEKLIQSHIWKTVLHHSIFFWYSFHNNKLMN